MINSQPFSLSPSIFSLYLTLLIFTKISLSLTSNNLYTNCTTTFNCGSITNIGYPFWGASRHVGCGYPDLMLKCEKNITTMEITNVKYQVLEANTRYQTLNITRYGYKNGLCPTNEFNNTSPINSKLLEYVPGYGEYLTLLYGCKQVPISLSLPGQFKCPGFGTGYMKIIGVSDSVRFVTCNASVVIPVFWSGLLEKISDLEEMKRVIREGFAVKWKLENGDKCEECLKSGGVCGYDLKLNQPTCYCPKSSFGTGTCSSSSTTPTLSPATTSEKRKKTGNTMKIGIAIGSVIFVAILLGSWVFYVKKKKYVMKSKSKAISMPPSTKELPTTFTNLSHESIPPYPSLNSNLERPSSYFGVQVFSYTELEKATHNFDPSRELGDGGYGTVYYGKLDDGREVAVKRLYETNFKRVERFMNEVDILTRLHHPNLVKLYGCTSRHSHELLLVYEYIPNGTLADHLHGTRANSRSLTWPVRLNIAIETADALSYLHRKEIIHRDVKTSNILLDNDFHVKVADFGLSRLFPTNVSHVSTAPQGTPGYVDPEYYQCYKVTDKSDVYSFGVVLIELISSLQAVDTNRHKHDINLANMAVNKIHNRALHEIVDPNLGFGRDGGVRSMITLVGELGFRCLQQERDMRPCMEEVVEVLRRIKNEELGGIQKAEEVDIGKMMLGF